jgi:hypothetical protein
LPLPVTWERFSFLDNHTLDLLDSNGPIRVAG